ncbi:MAG: response regulator [Holophagaceae bacterium]|nr:response regulator [Holophagaceae bacterium]
MRLLLVEDKDSFRRLLIKALDGSGWEVFEAADPAKALEILETNSVEVLVTDLRLPDFSGLKLLRLAKRRNPSMRAILMSAFGEPKDIVDAIHSGADDFLSKPFDLDFFLERLNKLRVLALSPPPNEREPWIATSASMQTVENGLRTLSDTAKPVLFEGHAGTGRSRSARRLHALRHPSAPFHSWFARDIVPESLSESFLRDHDGGSLLLKDLEHLPATMLSPLISRIERHTDICWMGTCREQHKLPEPLKSHIGVLSMTLTPLSRRRDDILPIFHRYLTENCSRDGRMVPVVDHATEKELQEREWPGNVAELVWATSEALRMCQGGFVKELPQGFSQGARSLALTRPAKDKLERMLQGITSSAERFFLEEALKDADGDLALASERLGISAKNYIQKMKNYGISLKDV